MVICWKFSTRARRTFRIAGEDAVIRRSFRRGDGIGCNFGRDSPSNPIKKIQRLSVGVKLSSNSPPFLTERQWMITQARKGASPVSDMKQQLNRLTFQEVTINENCRLLGKR